MKAVLVLVILIGLIGASGTLAALDLGTAISEAMSANQGLQAERLRLGTLERSKNTALQNLYPQLNVGAGWQRWNDTSNQQKVVNIPQVPYPIIVPLDPQSLGLVVNAQLTLSLSSFAAVEKARAELDAGRIKLLSYQNTLKHEVKATFYRILFLQKSLELVKSQVDTAKARLAQVEAAYKSGSGPELDMLQSRIELQNRNNDVRAAEYTLNQARYGLCLLIGRTPDKSLVLDGTLEPAVPQKTADGAQLMLHYGDSRGDIAGLGAQKNILDIQSTQVAGLIVPQIVLGWSADPALNNPWSKDITDKSLWSQTNGALSIQVQWKLDSLLPGSNFWTTAANLDDQKAALLKNRDQARTAAQIEVQGIVERIEESRLSLPALEANAKDARRAASLAQIAFTAGVRNLLDAQDADVKARGAELGLLGEKLSLQLALIDLEQSLETPLEDIYELR